jgi:hypothetical protein
MSVNWSRLLAASCCGLALLSLAALADAEGLPEYNVVIGRDGTPVARVSLAIPKTGSKPSFLVSRAAKLGVSLQVRDVRCDGRELNSAEGRWQLPSDCRLATWNVPFLHPWPEGIQAGEQQSIVMPGGWLIFSDPSSLLRLKPELDGTPITFSGSGIVTQTQVVRSVGFAPSYFVLGDAPQWSVQDGAFKLTYIADDLAVVKSLVDPAQHLKGLAYYRRVMGSVARNVDEVTVVWIPIAGDTHGGAAGHNMFLVNYALNPSPAKRRQPVITLLHEQFHQIDGGGIRSKYRPTWVSESLAQFYALKTALHLSDNHADFVALWNRWFERAEKDEGKILDVQREVKAGDFSRYGFFYSRGSMFWRDIESALKRAGQRNGLDDALPIILAASFLSDGSLPADVHVALKAIPEAELAALIAKYL